MGKKIKDKNCQLVQELIITSDDYNKVTHVDMQKIKDHIKRCKTCRHYRVIIDNIFNSMKLQRFKDTDIEKRIKRNLISDLKKKRRTGDESYWNLIVRFFKYKIPIYQSALAFIIVFIMIYGMKNIHFKDRKNDMIKKSVDSLKTSPIPMEYNYVIENLEIIKVQRVGESIEEDSSVIQLSYPIL
jgi:hypothetical protein